ncbi:MAG TPA: hypothetical protein VIO38_01875 [Rariglobus sp.]|jgi:hypothetical protein
MSTLAKTKKPARKLAAPRASKAAAPRARLTPPPGPTAREVMANYPDPSPDFDADFVTKVVAARSHR